MKVTYDSQTNTMQIILQEGRPVTESDEDKAGVILDYDIEGSLVGLEILDASRRITEVHRIDFEVV